MSQQKEVHRVTVFTPFEFSIGQKIHIDGGPRRGDWEVIGVSEKKVKLRCPVSSREFEWNRFCYRSGEQVYTTWPGKD
jgi:hypothetical protein